ncbi:MAG TPA: PH domain-containing protein [Nitrososphaeraceae archaeon]|nr:PH domain-containing protein [Nitrososphaeraceae archaeon]
MMSIEQKHNEYLSLSLKGFFGVILPFTNKIKIPYSAINEVLTDTVKIDKTKTIKFIGVSMGNRNIGIFYVIGKGKVFYAFYRKNKCITLKLKNDFKYKEVIVEVEDKERVAQGIISHLQKNK